MPVLNGSGIIFTSTAGSTAATGTWYSIPQGWGRPAVQAVLVASSVGATAGTTVTIEVSNTTAAAVATKLATIGLTCTTDTVSDGAGLSSSMVGGWRFIRAVLTSLTTSTAGSAGSPSVNVYVGLSKQD